MNRRLFLQKSTLFIPGLTLSGIMGFNPRKIIASTTMSNSFSLSIMSDQPERALTLIQEHLTKTNLHGNNINYSEYILHGSHMADIALTHSGKLVDYHNTDGQMSEGLRKIANKLGLPRECDNPVLSHFSCEESLRKPTGIQVFKGNELIMEKPFAANDDVFELDGVKGKVCIELTKDRTVRFTETSCHHKTCLKMGTISQAGQNLICIPNQITVSIAGRDVSGVDSISF